MHASQIERWFHGRRTADAEGEVGDANGMVGHAFEFDGHVHRCNDAAQVAGGRLFSGDRAHARLLDLVAQGVDRLIPGDDFARECDVVLLQRVHGPLGLLLDHAAHAPQVKRHGAEVVVESRTLHKMPVAMRFQLCLRLAGCSVAG